jgi:hypothetical protein
MGLEDAGRRIEEDPDVLEVAGAIYRATHPPFVPCVILVAAEDAKVWREHTWNLRPRGAVTIVETALMLPGCARVGS